MGLFGDKESKEKKKQAFNEFKSQGKIIGFAAGKYLGGHPDILVSLDGMIHVNPSGIFFDASLSNQFFFIPISQIMKSELKTEEQISKDVTLTRLVALGIFAFGLKKKRIEKQFYLIITYIDAGIENTIAVETNAVASTASSAIVKFRMEYAKTNPEIVSTNEDINSIPNMLKKLSDLKNDGILTEAEFNEKKKELLAKI